MHVFHSKWVRFTWILLLLASALHAQNGAYADHITGADGLSQGAIFDILQDAEGFMWFGTKDGLNRFDGYDFKVFTNDPDNPNSISGNTITQLFEDSKGRIWAAADNIGVDIYDKKSGRFHHLLYDPLNPGGLSGSHIITMVEDTSGYFILNVDEIEINMFTLDTAFFENQQAPQVIRIPMSANIERVNFPNSLIKGLAKDVKGRIWVGGNDAIYRLDVQKAKLTLAATGYSFGASVNNSDGSMWAAGHFQTLFYWDGKKATNTPDSLNAIQHMCSDNVNNFWIQRADSIYGLHFQGLPPNTPGFDYQNNIFFRWAPNIKNEDYPLLSISSDRSGNIWIGSNGYGLYKINPTQTQFLHKLPGISVRRIYMVSKNKFFAHSYAGWFQVDGTNNTLASMDIPGWNDNHEKMLVSQSGDYWVRETSTIENIYLLKRYNPNTKVFKVFEIPWYHYDSQPIIEAKNGVIWMAGFNQVLTGIDPITERIYSYHLDNGKSFNVNNKGEKVLSKEYSTALYEDIKGVLWVGTEKGIVKCIRPSDQKDDLQVSHYKNIPGDQNSLGYNHVMCFLDDPAMPEKYLWVCTKGGGLNRMDKTNGTFIRLTKENGLPDNVIYGLLSDQKGNLWGSTNKGIFCMLHSDPEIGKYTFRNFSQKNGLQGEEFNTGAYAKSPDGKLLFGGVNGLSVFDPLQVLSDDFDSPIQITKILVGNEEILPGDKTGILLNTIETTRQIKLNHQQDILTLEFASLDFTAPERNRYRYQLIGANDTWIEAGEQRSATFLHLKPKDYTFRVQGTNSQGVWSSQVAELNIIVLPPWWNTWLAYMIYAALIAAIIYAYMRFSINRVKLNQQLAFEKREADRIRELDVQKTQLYMNMTHEFRTPLTIILGMAKQLKENPKGQEDGGVNMIIRNGENLLGLVNKMLSLSKLEDGKMQLNLVREDIIDFLKKLTTSFYSLVEQKEIQLHFLPEIDTLVTSFDPDKLQQIISNLISNAYKFTPENGNIYLIVKVENDSLVLRVKDTGSGISEAELSNVFDRFYQADTTTTRQYEGTGIGLALTKELVTLMSGNISVQSPPAGAEKGTEFIVIIPLLSELGVKVKSRIETSKLIQSSISEIPVLDLATPSKKTIHVVPQKQSSNAEPLILLVEDNADVVAYVASCIRGNASDDQSMNYRLAVAENGQEGLDLAIELIPDLIISDVMMPFMDGFELLNHLKSDERTNHIPVVILTARADLKSKLEGLEIGANAYLPKPFEKKELLFTIKNLFDLRQNLRLQYQQVIRQELPSEVDTSMRSELVEIIKTEDPFVQKVRGIIEANISNFEFEVGQIAQKLHLSHSQLGRKLDALIGYSPNRFIRLIKLKKAKELLVDEQLSITAIAFDCGFSDPSYFARVFKKEFGKSPAEWREEVSTD